MYGLAGVKFHKPFHRSARRVPQQFYFIEKPSFVVVVKEEIVHPVCLQNVLIAALMHRGSPASIKTLLHCLCDSPCRSSTNHWPRLYMITWNANARSRLRSWTAIQRDILLKDNFLTAGTLPTVRCGRPCLLRYLSWRPSSARYWCCRKRPSHSNPWSTFSFVNAGRVGSRGTPVGGRNTRVYI